MKKIFLFSLGILFNIFSYGQTSTLIFSEYIEGTSNEKYLELYNGTGASINLSGYTIELYSNGSAIPTNTHFFAGTLNNNQTLVLRNSAATLYTSTGITSAVCSFNGNDALVLKNGATILDVIGQVGCDPGSRWIIGSFQTLDKTLIRKPDICTGYDGTGGGACGVVSFPTLTSEWIQKNTNDVSNLGSHLNSCGVTGVTDNYFRTRQSGLWYDINTWESSSTLGGTYSSAVKYPTYNNSEYINILAVHDVSITNSSLVADQVNVAGKLSIGRFADLDLNDGTGVELTVAGTFTDSSESVNNYGILALTGTETWDLLANAHFYKLRNTSSTFYRDNFNTGIANIPASATWHLRCVDAANLPSFLSANMTYPNLSFENVSGTPWDMTSAVNTFSSSIGPTIKGDFNIAVDFFANSDITVVQNASNASATSTPITVLGNVNINQGKFINEKTGAPNLYGGGLDVKGNINLFETGAIEIKNNPTDRVKSALTFSGGNTQNITTTFGFGSPVSISLSALELNKTGASLSVITTEVPVYVYDSLYLTSGYLHTYANLGIFEDAALHLYDTTVISSPNSQFNTCCAITNIGWESSFVSGPVIRDINNTLTGQKWLPIGKVTATDTTYAPVALEKANATLASYVAEYFKTSYSDLTVDLGQLQRVSKIEHWLVRSFNAGVDAKITLSWRPSSRVGDGIPAHDMEAMDSLCLAHYFFDGSSTKWRIDGYVNSTTPGFTKLGNVNYGTISTNIPTGSFSPFTLGGKSPYNILPLKFIDFTATENNDHVQLKWIVAQEQSIEKYIIEKSSNGINFSNSTTIFSLKSSAAKTYLHNDPDPFAGWNYYRIRIMEDNGTFSYSKIIKVWVGKTMDVKIYPGIVSDEIKINLPLSSSKFIIQLVNSVGQVVQQLSTNQQALSLPVKSLSKGIYFIKILGGRQAIVQRFIKL